MPPRRTSQQDTPERSAATASRRVAVKSSTLGSPHSSPMTQERAAHLRPSSIAHSASLASRASTWMRFGLGRPGGWIRPLSRIAMRSWTHSVGRSVATCASRNPAQPPSRGWTANSSDRVVFLPHISGGGGPHEVRWRGLSAASRTPPSRLRRATSPAKAGEETSGRAETAPPATRDKPLATRLTTLMFCFCSCLATQGQESMVRLGQPKLFQKSPHFAHDLPRPAPGYGERHVRAAHLHLLVALVLEPAGGARRDDPVATRP